MQRVIKGARELARRLWVWSLVQVIKMIPGCGYVAVLAQHMYDTEFKPEPARPIGQPTPRDRLPSNYRVRKPRPFGESIARFGASFCPWCGLDMPDDGRDPLLERCCGLCATFSIHERKQRNPAMGALYDAALMYDRQQAMGWPASIVSPD